MLLQVRDHGDQTWEGGDARIPPRDRDRGRRPPPGLPLRVAGPEVLGCSGWLLRVARGRPDRRMAPDHGLPAWYSDQILKQSNALSDLVSPLTLMCCNFVC